MKRYDCDSSPLTLRESLERAHSEAERIKNALGAYELCRMVRRQLERDLERWKEHIQLLSAVIELEELDPVKGLDPLASGWDPALPETGPAWDKKEANDAADSR